MSVNFFKPQGREVFFFLQGWHGVLFSQTSNEESIITPKCFYNISIFVFISLFFIYIFYVLRGERHKRSVEIHIYSYF